MKKIISAIILITAFSAVLSADALRDFSIVLGGGATVAAGTQLAITITANDVLGAQKTDFIGPIGFNASIGDIIINETGNTLTQTFTSGRWTGIIQVLGSALPLTLTCVDAPTGATGTAFKIVTPNVYTGPFVIMAGMTWAPGTAAGYTGWPLTQTTTAPFYVTVLAVDSYYNTINSGFPKVRIETTSNGKAVTPSSIDMSVDAKANTIFAATLYPNPDLSAPYGITARDMGDPLKFETQQVFFASLNDFYIWAKGPASAVAGQNFTATVVMSHFAPPDGVPIPGFNDTVQIAAIDFAGNSLNPGLLPVAQPIAPLSNGTVDFTVNYIKSSPNDVTGIKISPVYYGTKSINNGYLPSKYSNVIVIYAAAPASFTLDADKVKLNKNENAVLKVKISDTYLNPVSNTAVNFSVIDGGGMLKDSNGSLSIIKPVITDVYGYAYITVTASSNTITTVSASVQGIAAAQTKQFEFADIIDTKIARNFPNPFNPAIEMTTIEYYLNSDAEVDMTLYSFSGSQVWKKNFSAGAFPGGRKGYNSYCWNGMTDRNMSLAVGVYTLKIIVKDPAGKYTLTRKIAVKK